MAKPSYTTKADLRFVHTSLKKDIKKLEGRILDSEVKIIGELKDMREEFGAHQHSHARIDDTLMKHDSWIKKLETIKV